MQITQILEPVSRRLRLLLSLFVMLLPLQAAAQSCGTRDLISELTPEQRQELDALVAPHPFPTGNLWKATKSDANVVVVGTIHVPDPRLQAITDLVSEDVRNADLLILEATAEDEAGLQVLAAQKPEMFFITSGPTLIDLLGEETWKKVKPRVTAMGIPGFLAAKFQPWYLSMTLAIPPCAFGAIQSGERGLDRQIELVAKDAGVPRVAIEDAESVLRIFSDEPLEDQLNGLRISIETLVAGNDAASTLIEGYFDGRIRETWEFTRILINELGIENGQEMFEELTQALLVGRNKRWEPKLLQLVEGKQAVVAVGAAHLSGESGVLRALERGGYQITPLLP